MLVVCFCLLTVICYASMANAAYQIVSIQGKQIGLQLPNGYANDQAYPLIVFLHGRGGSASANNFTSDAFASFRSKASARGYIVMVPNYGSDGWINQAAEDIVTQSINLLQSQYKTNPQKLYMMGVSMGGGGALVYGARHKQNVAAICDLMGMTDMVKFYSDSLNYQTSISTAYGGSPVQAPDIYSQRSAMSYIDDLNSLPVYISHGSADNIVSSIHSEQLYNALNSAGGSVSFKSVPGIGHDNAIIAGQEDAILNLFDSSLVVVPEPGSVTALMSGIAALAIRRKF